MSRRHEDGSVTLEPAEVAALLLDIARWERACRRPGADTASPLVALGIDVRALLDV